MSGLVLKLGPGERVLINGAVIKNGDRRSSLSVLTPNANVLRLRDMIPAERATTPVGRLCLIVQRVLAGDIAAGEARPQLLQGLDRLERSADAEGRLRLGRARQAVQQGQPYVALRELRGLLARESCAVAPGDG